MIWKRAILSGLMVLVLVLTLFAMWSTFYTSETIEVPIRNEIENAVVGKHEIRDVQNAYGFRKAMREMGIEVYGTNAVSKVSLLFIEDFLKLIPDNAIIFVYWGEDISSYSHYPGGNSARKNYVAFDPEKNVLYQYSDVYQYEGIFAGRTSEHLYFSQSNFYILWGATIGIVFVGFLIAVAIGRKDEK